MHFGDGFDVFSDGQTYALVAMGRPISWLRSETGPTPLTGAVWRGKFNKCYSKQLVEETSDA